jgi:hypothetical protein
MTYFPPRLRLIATIGLCLLVASCGHDNARLQERIAYWRGSLDRDVPQGTAASTAQAWLQERGVHVELLKQQRWLYANVERVPEPGLFPFPCSQWNIIVKIPLDTQNRTVGNDVSAVGTCL